MRKLKIYLKFFWPVLLLVVIAVLGMIYLPSKLDDFQTGLFSAGLGAAVSIAAVEGIKKITERKRKKRVAALLKLVTVTYLQNQCLNFKENSKLYKDMGSVEHALAFLLLVKNYDKVSVSFDKNWFQLVYSSDFIDSIDADSQLNAIGHAISEILIFNKTITWCSLNASRLLDREARTELNQEDAEHFILQARNIRDHIDVSIEKLEKYTKELDDELAKIFTQTGVTYEEIER
jgi:hypothetical protein